MKLSDPVQAVPLIGPALEISLNRLGIYAVEDLLFHIPTRLNDFSNVVSIKNLQIGEPTTITGEVVSIDNVYTKTGKNLQIAKVTDGEGILQVMWMRQPYLLRVLHPGQVVSLSGELKFWGKQKAFIFPQYEILQSSGGIAKGKIIPIYPLTEGISSKKLASRIKYVLNNTELPEDYLDPNTQDRYKLLNLADAIRKIHLPDSEEDWHEARKRLAFDELLLLQIQNTFKRLEYQASTKPYRFHVDNKYLSEFVEGLPFELTSSQKRVFSEILESFIKKYPMNRLLEGDVGSGKTIIAAFGIFISFLNNLQSVVLAPTQVLAEQHYQTLSQVLSGFNINVALVTSTKTESQEGKQDLFVGTHALLHRPNLFDDTGFVVIDEQHRFGVKQRALILDHARSAEFTPHLLSMTATPIPRTITLTLYGDLDLSSLDELPSGRKEIKTWVVPKRKRKSAYTWIEEEIRQNDAQAFVVCPLIEESESERFKQVKAATTEYENLLKVFPDLNIGLLHGRLKSKEKSQVLQDYRDKKYDILVTTPVVEVGVDIPNATIMMIEAADRFGLAQIHQLRGRVGRGDKQSYCLLFTDSSSKKSLSRLKIVSQNSQGRVLAQHDLETRGPGEIFGLRQHGVPELKIASWTDIDLIKKTRKFAETVVENQDKHKALLDHYESKIIAKN